MRKLLFALSFLFLLTGCDKNKEIEENTKESQKPKQTVESTEETTKNDEENKSGVKAISLEELKEKYTDSDWVIVDTRLSDSYNGWKLYGEKRSGHIPNAVDFSANWLKVEKENKEEILDIALKDKGIIKNKNIVLYDANDLDAKEVAEYLIEKGYENIYTYNITQWAEDESLPLETYKNYHLIVPAKIVKEIVDGEKPETFEKAKNIKIVEASWGEESETYEKGHIPTAFHINTDSIEPPPTWMLDSDENLSKWAEENGFTADDTVIVTGTQMAAYRVAVVLRYIGVSDVRVLNGGDEAYKAAGYELVTERFTPSPVDDFGLEIPVNKDIIVTIPELKEYLEKPNEYVLIDNRGYDEFIGESSGYSYHDKKGRIPGAVFGYAGTSGSSGLEYFRNIDETMKNKDEILKLWEDIDLNKNVMFMCGSGWRAAEILYYADVLGMDKISLYSDGWIGWSNDLDNPFETGEVE